MSGELKKVNKSHLISILIVLILVPLTIVAGYFLLGDRKYFIISFLIAVYALLLFFIAFEFKKPSARDVIILAVLIAIAVVGRAAFFMTPNFKPITAIVMIAGVSLGAEAGFIVGAMSGFVSNFLFGQGPWTPWQMLAFGIIGFISGLIFSERGYDFSKKHALAVLAVCGAVMTFLIYGGIVDLWTILGFTAEPSVAVAITVYTVAIPFNLIHAASTAVFLVILGKPMIEKLERTKRKFGLRI